MLFKRIQQLCAEKKITISRVERECGLANAAIRKWENSSPSTESLVKVADYFGISTDALLGRNYGLSESALQYAKQFDALSEEKKQLAAAYMGVVQAQ